MRLKASITQFTISLTLFLIVFEEFIATRLGSVNLTLIAKQVPDILILLLFIIKLPHLKIKNKGFSYFLLFFLYALILSLSTNDVFVSLANFKAFFRYSLIIFIVWGNPNFNSKEFQKIYQILLLVQIIIGLIQLVDPNFARPNEVYGTTVATFTKYISGTFANTISFAYFIIGYQILFGFKNIYKVLALVVVSLTGAIIPLITFVILLMKKEYLKYLFLSILPILILKFTEVISIDYHDSEFTKLFDPEFWLFIFEKQRGALILGVILPLIFSWNIILGYGPVINDNLYNKIQSPIVSEYLFAMTEDVYLFLMPIYFGIIGISLYALFLTFFFKKLPSNNLKSLMIPFLILNLANQAIETKIFGFIFYLAIAHFLNKSTKAVEVIEKT